VGGGTYCIGGAGVDVSLNPSEVNVRYSLFRDGAPSGLLPMEAQAALLISVRKQ